MKQKLELLSEQLQNERTTLHSLEEVISEKRKNEFAAETALQQLQVEKIQLQRKVSKNTLLVFDVVVYGILQITFDLTIKNL